MIASDHVIVGELPSLGQESRPAATTAFVTIEVRHVYRGASYDPQAGAVNHIDYRETQIRLVPSTGDIGTTAVIEQNGILHVAPLTGGIFSNAARMPIAVTLRAANFTPRPDFSANGAPMWFGFARSNSQRFPITLEHGIDNWAVTIWR